MFGPTFNILNVCRRNPKHLKPSYTNAIFFNSLELTSGAYVAPIVLTEVSRIALQACCSQWSVRQNLTTGGAMVAAIFVFLRGSASAILDGLD